MDRTMAMKGGGVETEIAARVRAQLCQLRVERDGLGQCDATSAGSVRAGPVDVVRFEGLGTPRGSRQATDIRADDADYYIFTVPVSARFQTRQLGAWQDTAPGQFFFLSTARPFQTVIHPEQNSRFSSLHARVSGQLLRQRLPAVDALCGSSLPVLPGPGRVMQSLLDLAVREGHALSPRQAGQLGDMVLESLYSVLDAIGARAPGHDGTSREQRLAKIRGSAEAYIRAHLGNPALNPEQIAEHCGISVRQLYNAFAGERPGISAYIRERRLLACRTALQDARALARSITDIAGDFGFDDAAHFCRMYKRRFGRSPRADRLG